MINNITLAEVILEVIELAESTASADRGASSS